MTSDFTAGHELDLVVWRSLTTHHSMWAEGDERVKRYPPDMAPFHAMRDFTDASFASLARFSTPDHLVSLVTVAPVIVPAAFELVLSKGLNQMLGPLSVSRVDSSDLELLGPSDLPAMLSLVDAAQPGPFGPRTNQFGQYFGVRAGDQLIAMTGERMRPAGFTELSAVSVHPSARGKGYAGRLLLHLCHLTIERGERPFLHVFDDNLSAIALYQKHGFELRRTMQLTVMRKRR